MTTRDELKNVLEKIYNKEVSLDEIYIDDLVNRTIEWFETYQGDEDPNKMVELYGKLIDEETNETSNAWINKDIVEVLDGITDVIYVTLGYIYFGWKARQEDERRKKDELIIEMSKYLIMRYSSAFIPLDLFKLAYLEVLYSNWTKSLEKRGEDDKEGKAGKIIKGKDYIKPDLEKVFKFIKKLKK